MNSNRFQIFNPYLYFETVNADSMIAWSGGRPKQHGKSQKNQETVHQVYWVSLATNLTKTIQPSVVEHNHQ